MYKVVKSFFDLQDENHSYCVGDVFPRFGFDVSDKRLIELAGKENKLGVPVIREMREQPKTTKTKKT